MDCIFCRIAAGQIPSTKIYEDETVVALADISPITPGHTLIIPKRHAENIHDIDPEILGRLHQAAAKVAAAIKRGLEPDGLVALQLNGRAAGQLVMHYHLHLVPRYEGDGVTAFDWTPQQGDPDEVQKTADKIVAALG
ncbi:MAG: HIT family protein [Proteobacteria bacterium]|nr:HIT family protein [Pseudomonadota bacterium]MBU1740591.1 HIT family protein [Pseudomonadota bacterium]